jgi:hypothetical protein
VHSPARTVVLPSSPLWKESHTLGTKATATLARLVKGRVLTPPFGPSHAYAERSFSGKS